MADLKEAVIISAVRTPPGSFKALLRAFLPRIWAQWWCEKASNALA